MDHRSPANQQSVPEDQHIRKSEYWLRGCGNRECGLLKQKLATQMVIIIIQSNLPTSLSPSLQNDISFPSSVVDTLLVSMSNAGHWSVEIVIRIVQDSVIYRNCPPGLNIIHA